VAETVEPRQPCALTSEYRKILADGALEEKLYLHCGRCRDKAAYHTALWHSRRDVISFVPNSFRSEEAPAVRSSSRFAYWRTDLFYEELRPGGRAAEPPAFLHTGNESARRDVRFAWVGQVHKGARVGVSRSLHEACTCAQVHASEPTGNFFATR
jgi:hypothetical protein